MPETAPSQSSASFSPVCHSTYAHTGTEPAESGEIVRLCGKKDDDNSVSSSPNNALDILDPQCARLGYG